MRAGRGWNRCAAYVLVAAGASQSAMAQADPQTKVDPAPATNGQTVPSGEHAMEESLNAATESKEFQLTFAPYIWLCGVDGTTGTGGVTLDVDADFWDIWNESDSLFGIMGALDIEYKRFVLQLTGSYTQVEASDGRGRARSGALGGGITAGVSADVEIQTGFYEAMGGYRFVESAWGKSDENSFSLDGFVGGRFTDMQLQQDVTADVTITLPDGRVLEAGRTRSMDDNQGWFEPFVGMRSEIGFGKHWAMVFRGDVGGFDVDGDQFAWQALGAVGYRLPQEGGGSIDLFAGYRVLSQDYTNADYVWSAMTLGPILGAQFVWRF
ncbi:MAG: hypothetical protein GIKADHBN_00263 [Phycisphaerales bacterium]|nr:hypothetical protein [Phycisphaerales bacterium]